MIFNNIIISLNCGQWF